MRVGLYADDAVIFANPCHEEVNKLMCILQLFGDATGLWINPLKSTVAAIRCESIDLAQVLENFGGQTVDFPMKYVSLPITLTRVRLVQL